MKDIEIAVELLEKEQLTIAIVRDGKLIYSSNDKGIMPLYAAHMNNVDLKNSSVADRVTGKAAAMICANACIKELNTKVISDSALNVLKKTNIEYNYSVHTPYIKNRDKSGMCPVETLSIKVDNIDDLMSEIKKFFTGLK